MIMHRAFCFTFFKYWEQLIYATVFVVYAYPSFGQLIEVRKISSLWWKRLKMGIESSKLLPSLFSFKDDETVVNIKKTFIIITHHSQIHRNKQHNETLA